MIYGMEDLIILKRISNRKMCETTSLANDPRLASEKAEAVMSRISYDITRIRFMNDVGNNVFVNFSDRFASFMGGIDDVESDSDYLSLLAPEDAIDEAFYTRLVSRLKGYAGVFENAIIASDLMSSGGFHMDGQAVNGITKARFCLQSLMDEGDHPPTIKELAATLDELCVMVQSIGAAKPVSNREIAAMVDGLVSRNFTPLIEYSEEYLDPELSSGAASLVGSIDDLLSIIIARAISNSALPESAF